MIENVLAGSATMIWLEERNGKSTVWGYRVEVPSNVRPAAVASPPAICRDTVRRVKIEIARRVLEGCGGTLELCRTQAALRA